MSFELLIAANGESANVVVRNDWSVVPLGDQETLRHHIFEHFTTAEEVSRKEIWVSIEGCGVRIELSRLEDSEEKKDHPFDFLVVTITGGGNPIPEFAAFCKRNGWYLADMQNDSWVDLDNPKTCWDGYQRARRSLIESDGTTINRHVNGD